MAADPLALETRRRIYQHVVRQPGSYLREIQRALDMAMGALEHHLDALVAAGLITVLQEGNKRFFPAEIDRRDKRILSFLRQELPRRALVALIQNGATTKSGLMNALDVAPSTLNYHLRHLTDVGLITASRDGREAVYRVMDADGILRLLITYRSNFLDRVVDRFLEGMDALR